MTTQRISRLTSPQIAQRVELTWQSMDFALYQAVHGTDEQFE